MFDKGKKQEKESNKQPQNTLEGAGLPKEVRRTVEPLLRAFNKSDETLLPKRIDRKYRERLVHEIKSLHFYNVGRVIELSNCKMEAGSGKAGWKRTNEGGREWREGNIQGTLRDRLVRLSTGETISERRIRDGLVTIVQSRRISSQGAKENKSAVHNQKEKIICQSCGGEVHRNAEVVLCPYCGAYIESGFYNWQLESFEIGRQSRKRFKYYGLLLAIVVLSAVAGMLLAETWYEGLFPGLFAGIVIGLVYITILLLLKDPTKQIVRYSANTLRKNLTQYFWEESTGSDLLEINLDEFEVKKVVHSETETRIIVKARLREQQYSPAGKIASKGRSRKLVLKRARFPDRLKEKGAILQEKACPSCGGNYIPDSKGNCSYCGYGLHVQNRNWKVEEVIR